MAVFSDLHPRHVPPSILPSSSCSGINAWTAVGDGHDVASYILTSTDNQPDARLPAVPLWIHRELGSQSPSYTYVFLCFHSSSSSGAVHRRPRSAASGCSLGARLRCEAHRVIAGPRCRSRSHAGTLAASARVSTLFWGFVRSLRLLPWYRRGE